MGISHEYHSYSRRGYHGRRRSAVVPRLIGAAAAILILSAAVTAIITKSTEEKNAASQINASGNVQAILAPLPMQGEEAAAGTEEADAGAEATETEEAAPETAAAVEAVEIEKFGPSRQYDGAYTLKAYDSSVIRQPSCGQVDLSYFADAAFLGDSLTVGFTDYKVNLGGALVCAYTGAGPDTVVNRTSAVSSVRGEEVALDVLAAAQPKKLYILLGTNMLATAGSEERFLTYYGQMLDLLRQTLGEACVIYVQSVPPVRAEAAAEKPGLATETLRAVNERLAALAAEKGCVYLDLWEVMADGEGNLKEMIAAPDGVHLSAGNGYGTWVTYLRNHAKYSADNAWTAGSDYSAE